ncbi:MAG: hypothetical protein JO307_30915 [Bryobacterales bacterium]|nr:hypothetical protein [Bryobacterales bacterium]MBV9399760.1 hypothetical protein [Bryobacterales bacterium]
MRSLLLFVTVALLSVAPAAHAQFGSNNLYSPTEVTALVDRVHTDLNHAYSVWHFSDSDRDRLNHAEKELREFSATWSKGKFDKGKLDDAIGAVQHVLDENRLPAEARDALSDDVARLRRMREAYDRHEIG